MDSSHAVIDFNFVILTASIGLFVFPAVINCDDTYTLKPLDINVDGDKPIRIYTSEEMGRHDGSDPDAPILMGIKGVVFDVSSGERFYGKKSAYNVLVGKDSTRAVAKMSLDPEDLTHDITGLSPAHLKALDDVFESTYISKYPVAGYMDYVLEQYPEKFAKAETIRSEL